MEIRNQHENTPREIKPRETEVAPVSCKIANSQGRLIARNVSSELLLVLYGGEAKVGMMLRIEDQPNQLLFAKAALELFFSELASLGIQRQSLTVNAIGGVAEDSDCVTGLRRFLQSERVAITGTDLGDEQDRSVWLALDSGRLIVRAASQRANDPAIISRQARLAS